MAGVMGGWEVWLEVWWVWVWVRVSGVSSRAGGGFGSGSGLVVADLGCCCCCILSSTACRASLLCVWMLCGRHVDACRGCQPATRSGHLPLTGFYTVPQVCDKLPDVGRKVEYLLNTGNLVSKSGLDLSQASGFTVVAEKLNWFRYLSHFRSVHRGAYFAEIRTTAVRKLLPESWGFMCPVHTPDGSPCGLLNHFTSACRVVTAGPDEPGRTEAAILQVTTWFYMCFFHFRIFIVLLIIVCGSLCLVLGLLLWSRCRRTYLTLCPPHAVMFQIFPLA